MAAEFDPDDLKAQLAKLDDYEIERRIERKMWEGQRLKVAQKVLKERIRSRKPQSRQTSIALGVGDDLRLPNHQSRIRALRIQRPHLLTQGAA